MSKELDALKRLMADYYEMCQDLGNNDDQYQRCNLTSERAIIEKALKALEIIREIGFYEIDYMLCVGYDTYCESRDKPIEKEKYDLLKEVLS